MEQAENPKGDSATLRISDKEKGPAWETVRQEEISKQAQCSPAPREALKTEGKKATDVAEKRQYPWHEGSHPLYPQFPCPWP